MFCTNCGANIPDNSTVCPSCGMQFAPAAPQAPQAPANNMYQQPVNNYNQAPVNPQGSFTQAPFDQQANQSYNYNSNMNVQPQAEAPKAKSSLGGISLALGIVGIAGSIILGICFGVPAAALTLVLSVCGIVLGITAKKQTGGQSGTGGVVCSIIGIVLSFIMTVGCASVGTSIADDFGVDYGCYGCIGGSCKASSDVKHTYDKYSKDFDDFEKELNNALNGINWDDFN